MKTLHVFGNEYLEEDALARTVADRLQDVSVKHCRSPDDLLTSQDEELLILDVVKGATSVVTITDINELSTRNIVTMHDFDLGYFLTLLAELGMDRPVRIIGIPQRGDPAALAREVSACL